MKWLLLILFASPVYAFHQPQPELKWKYHTGEAVKCVAISPTGKYIAIGFGNDVVLLNASKDVLWRVETETSVTAVAVSDKRDVIAGDEARVYFYKNGSKSWEKYIGDDIWDVAFKQGMVASASKNRKVYVFDSKGNILWTYKAEAPVRCIALSDKEVVFGTSIGMVYLLDVNGNLKWKYNTRKFVNDIAFFSENVIAASTYLSYLKDGKMVGYYITPEEVVAIGTTANYTIAGLSDGVIYSIDKKKLLWSYDAKALETLSVSQFGDMAIASGEHVLLLSPPDMLPPAIKVLVPRNKSKISGIVKILAITNEPSTFRVFIDENFACGTIPCNWDTSASSEGKHIIRIEAKDGGGNIGNAVIEVTVERALVQDVTETISKKIGRFEIFIFVFVVVLAFFLTKKKKKKYKYKR